jgi:hypothetical protein
MLSHIPQIGTVAVGALIGRSLQEMAEESLQHRLAFNDDQMSLIQTKGTAIISIASNASKAAERQGFLGGQDELNPVLEAVGKRVASAHLSEKTVQAFLWIEDMTEFIIGLVLLLLAVPALWLFERQKARVDCLLSTGRSVCISIMGSEVSPKNNGQLIHLAGHTMRPEAPIEDPRFECNKLGHCCVRLRTEVQVCQWIERLGPGRGEPEYSLKWLEAECSSERFKDANKANVLPPSLSVGTTITNSGLVKIGTSYSLPNGLIDQCKGFEPVADLFGPEVTTLEEGLIFLRHTDGYFYWRPGGTRWTAAQVASAPTAGDARVCFEAVLAGPVTVLALQAEVESKFQLSSSGITATLLPYRLLPQPWWEDDRSKELRRNALVHEAKKSRIVLAQENQCCYRSRFCCGCNAVAAYCAGALTPEIFKLVEGNKSMEQCFADLRRHSNTNIGIGSVAFRLLVWCMIFLGILMAFSQVVLHEPIKSLPIVEIMGPCARFGMTALATLTISSMMIGFSCFHYKPFTAVSWTLFVLITLLILNYAVSPSLKNFPGNPFATAEFVPSNH